jgi:glycosyltransferase involved in cell wall biosynthesis
MGVINVFCMSSYYLPGYKSGGPVRTISAMVHNLSGCVQFNIFTTDRDLMDTESYIGINVNEWNKIGNAKVYYEKRSIFSPLHLISVIRKTSHEILYFNSFFDPSFTLLPLLARRIGLIPRKKTILAPRGEFSEGAIAIKSWKKKPFIFIGKNLGLYRDIIWHASSKYEAEDIRTIMGVSTEHIHIASDLTLVSPVKIESRIKVSGRLKICFISRLSPKKNLDYALRILQKTNDKLELDIYGPKEDPDYWKVCEDLIEKMANSVKITYQGIVDHSKIRETFSQYDLFFFPTKGENYGHVIIEAMLAGTPVLLSDTTPWRDLERIGVGWDLPLTNEDAFVNAIKVCLRKNNEDYIAWKQKVQEYAVEKISDLNVIEANRLLFLKHFDQKYER